MEEKNQAEAYLELRFSREEKRQQLMHELLDGVNEAAQFMLDEHGRQAERAFVLSAAMALEGIFTVLRQEILEEVRMNVTVEPFTISETVLLQARTFEIKENGRVKSRSARIPLERHVKFTCHCLMKTYGLTLEELCDDSSRGHIKTLTSMRNRLVHPKTSDDLRINQEEIDSVRACVSWLHKLLQTTTQANIDLWESAKDRDIHVPGARELTFFEIDENMMDPDAI